MVNVLLVAIIIAIFAFPSWAVKRAKDFSQNHDFSIGHYVQNRDDNVKSDQTVDVALTSVFIFQEKIKATSYWYYYYSHVTPSTSDWDDPIFTLTTLPKNIFPALKLRYYAISTVGLSRYSRDVSYQYGTLGLGMGAALDTDYLHVADYNLGATVSLNKSLVDGETTSEGQSNNNYYMAYGVTGSFNHAKWNLVIHFMFFQHFKFLTDESSETLLQFQDLGYQLTPSHNIGVGHSNRMGFYDDNSGQPNFRIVNPPSSYFYIRYTFSF